MADLSAVLVAARDEEAAIARTVEALRAAFPDVEVIVADDGSRDGTAATAERAGARVLSFPARGKGQALTLAERAGSEQRPADGVIVVRTAGKQYDGTASFLQGFYSGLIAAPVPVVGVETANATQSAMRAFQHNGISSVDDVDQPSGRFALALLLSGAQAGQYGIKSSAKDGVLPPLETATRG